ncbi:MAG: hypothetical protein RL077_3010 [Verrucomicrobiota bacterium]
MYPVPLLVDAVEAAIHRGGTAGDVIAIVGKLFAGLKSRRLAHDFIAFEDQLGAVGLADDPLAPVKDHGPRRVVFDGHVIDERMGFVFWERGAAAVVDESVERGGQTGDFRGSGHGGECK